MHALTPHSGRHRWSATTGGTRRSNRPTPRTRKNRTEGPLRDAG